MILVSLLGPFKPLTLPFFYPLPWAVHDCAEVTEMVYSAQPDLQDTLLQDLNMSLFSDDSSIVINGV